MKYLLSKLLLAVGLSLGLIFGLIGVMDHLSGSLPMVHAADRTVCLAGPPTCTYTNVQTAVDAATPGDVIKVAAGTYTGVYTRLVKPYGINPVKVFTQMVYISKSVTIRGGYTTTNSFAEPSDPAANSTILNAQGQGRVIFVDGTASTIEGLQLIDGEAKAGNSMFFNGRPYQGGGLLIINSNLSLHDNIIKNNQADHGGGLAMNNSSVVLTHNLIVSNKAITIGGGISVLSNTNVVINNNQILSNTASLGGGVYFDGAGFEGNTVKYNSADFGGGLYLYYINDKPMINNLIADNQANISGAGLYFRGGKTSLIHNTIARNSGGDGSGVYLAYEGPPFGSGVRVSLTNTIIVSQTVGITVEVGSTATLESTLWNGNATNWGGGGAVSASNSYTGTPAFVNPTSGNYHIGPGSAALDKGINAGVISDIDGESRPQGVGFDLGADEYFSSPMLSIQKAGPPTATASSPITFTLTITNTGPVSATNLVITDTIPVGAYYINGGVKVGNVVSWTIPGLAANGGVTQSTFVVTATQTITNDDYAVSAEGGYTVKGNSVVITVLSPEGDTSRQYLPVIWKQ